MEPERSEGLTGKLGNRKDFDPEGVPFDALFCIDKGTAVTIILALILLELPRSSESFVLKRSNFGDGVERLGTEELEPRSIANLLNFSFCYQALFQDRMQSGALAVQDDAATEMASRPASDDKSNPNSTQAREDRIKELEAILGNRKSDQSASQPPSPEKKPLVHQTSATSISSKHATNSLSRQVSQIGRDILNLGGGGTEDSQEDVGTDQQPPKSRLSGTQQQDFRLQKSNSGAGWVPLVSRDFKGKPKNAIPATDKALLAILEEERSKYNALEQTYHALLTEVKALQTAHIHEIKAADKRADSTVKNAQKQLLEKAEQQQATLQELKRLQTRFENLSKSREAETERFEFQNLRLSALVKESDQKCEVLERLVEELKAAKRELGDKVNKREAEMKKLIGMYKERENECTNERESRMKLELHILKLDQTVEQRDSEIRILKEQLKVKSTIADEAVKLKEALSDSCRETEQLSQREKMYLQEIETAANREKQLFSKLDELNGSYQRSVADFDRVNATCSSKAKEIDLLKQTELKLKAELNNTYQSNRAQSEEISELEKHLRQAHNERSSLNQDLADLRTFTTDLKNQLKQKNDEVNSLRELELQLRQDNQTLKTDLFATQDDYASLQSQLLEVAKRLESEVQSKSDIKNESKEKITIVTEKVYEIQRALATAQSQLEGSQQTEKLLRGTLQQKDVALNDQHHHLQEMEKQITDLRDVINKNEMVIETLKAKKKEDMIIVQEKFLAARQVMEQDVNTLKTQLNAKSVQAATLAEEATRMNFEISEITAEKFKLEMRMAELAANDSNQSRNIAALQQQLRIRDQELNVTSIKQQSLLEQVRLLEEELQSHRNLNLRKEGELQRIQNNVSEMNRKLREQVGVFLERTDVDSNASGAPSPYLPKKSVVSRQSTFSAGKSSPARDLLISTQVPSQKSITGMDDLDADLQQFLQFRGESHGGNGGFLSRPADNILSPEALEHAKRA
ncbi:UNVERIFIED_CONTAM: hypothetical protein HDU68_005335 [Siphonaria sp. JEL0065]|nr:hypothetical protein HDU68_005335 [Siphonaria sp. JEL0065]